MLREPLGRILAHLLVGSSHTASGLSPGDVLTAITATTFGFQAAGGGGVVEKTIDHTWEGDNTNNREIDLGDDYDLIFVWTNLAIGITGPWRAQAFRDTYEHQRLTNTYTIGYRGSDSDIYWQGKMTGVDANKILLGIDGASTLGFNYTGINYRLVGFKFSNME